MKIGDLNDKEMIWYEKYNYVVGGHNVPFRLKLSCSVYDWYHTKQWNWNLFFIVKKVTQYKGDLALKGMIWCENWWFEW